jgi:hypothetical protein
LHCKSFRGIATAFEGINLTVHRFAKLRKENKARNAKFPVKPEKKPVEYNRLF